MVRANRSKERKHVGKTEDQLGLPHARAITDEAIAEIQSIREADRDLEIVKEIAKTVPDGIIRAYRKAIRAQEELKTASDFPLIVRTNRWIIGIRWELAQLYPDLNKLPREE